MRILYSHRVQAHDGQSVHIEELVGAFRRAGHEVVVVAPGFYESGGFGGESGVIATIRRVLPRALFELGELAYNLPAFWRARRACRSLAPDFVYERYNLYYLAGIMLKRRYRLPLYLEVNSPLADERARFGGLGMPRLARAIERLTWRQADRVIVVTQVLGDIVAAAGVPRERITVTPNGIDRDAFPAAPYRARPGQPVTIGFVGFIRDWHGVGAVIEGLAQDTADPPARLVIVGPSETQISLEQQAAALGIAERVRFAGLQERAAIRKMLLDFDIVVQPQATPYASPLKLFEYMACGRAIVAPDQPNIREILTDGVDALLFDPAEAGGMWRAIRRLSGDPQLRERLGRAARATLDARDYTWQGNAERVAALARADVACRPHGEPQRLAPGSSLPEA